MTKNILKSKGINFEYKLLDELDSAERDSILAQAKDKGLTSLPLIVVDKELKTGVQEVIK